MGIACLNPMAQGSRCMAAREWSREEEGPGSNKMNSLRDSYSALLNRLGRPRQGQRDAFLQVSNLARQTVLATCIEVADRGERRRKGLLGRQQLSPGEGLWILPCEAVHTFGMKFSIDLIYLDREYRIRKLRSNVGPWSLSACLSAHSVLELAAGTIQQTQSKRGDKLKFSAALPSSPDVELTQPSTDLPRSRRGKR